jgi:hypothetical protein
MAQQSMNQSGKQVPSNDSAESRPRNRHSAEEYAAALEVDYGFESECVRARFGYLLRHLQHMKSRCILEVGCGLDLFVDVAIRCGLEFERWVVIEPASMLAQKAKARAASERRLFVVEGYCEDPAIETIVRELGPFDLVLLSGVLQDAADPAQLLDVSLSHATAGAHVVVTTPNALSFHRLLAVEMGLMPAPHSLSARNLRFRQNVVFDPDSLRKLLEQRGLCNLQFEGYLFKPFTHAQMGQVLQLLPINACEGLDRLGRKFPEHAAEIGYVGVKR